MFTVGAYGNLRYGEPSLSVGGGGRVVQVDQNGNEQPQVKGDRRVNRISGGTAHNILAAACGFNWDIRALPGDSPTRILDRLSAFVHSRLAELQKECKTCSIETTMEANAPPLEAAGGMAEELARLATQSEDASIAVPFATGAGQFQSAGWSTVVCGPGSIEQAHKPNEFIERPSRPDLGDRGHTEADIRQQSDLCRQNAWC